MPPMIRFNIQMPRRLNCVRTLFTKKVIPNHHANAPNAIARYPVTASNTSTPSLTKAKRAKSPINRKIISGLDSVTANAVMKL